MVLVTIYNLSADYGLKVLLKFVEKLLSDLIISKKVYHDVFKKILSVDYFTSVYRVIHDNLSADLGEVLTQANKKLVSIPGIIDIFRYFILLNERNVLPSSLNSMQECIVRSGAYGQSINHEKIWYIILFYSIYNEIWFNRLRINLFFGLPGQDTRSL